MFGIETSTPAQGNPLGIAIFFGVAIIAVIAISIAAYLERRDERKRSARAAA